MAESATWAVVVHGGCRPISPKEAPAHQAGCQAAADAAARVLGAGGSALDAVEAAVRVLEADPTFNAGQGAVRTADGEVEVDAAMMDGDTLALGAVAGAPALKHPISVARAMLEATPTLLVGEGAVRFARERGLAETVTDDGPRASGGCDTVGCVAIDGRGRIAAGTSTGGLEGCAPGRVGDSPLPGCGIYADSQAGGISASGEGEQIARSVLGARAVFAMEDGVEAQAAVEAALKRLERTGGEAGLIAIDRQGRIGVAHNAVQFAVGWASGATGEVRSRISGLEETATHG